MAHRRTEQFNPKKIQAENRLEKEVLKMSYKLNFDGKKKKYVSRSFDVTEITVQYQDVEAWNKYMHECMEAGQMPTDISRMNGQKTITVDGTMNESDALMFITHERVKYLAGQMPTAIVSLVYKKKSYKMLAETFRKYGTECTKQEADEIDAEK